MVSFESGQVHVVKPIYGMAQAGRRWQRTLFPWLKSHGFVQSGHDPCIFRLDRTQQTPSGPRPEALVVGVYVDDLCIAHTFTDQHSLYHSSQMLCKNGKWKTREISLIYWA